MANKTMGWKEAIKFVLQSKAEPMHYVDITESIVKNKLVNFEGATPARTVSYYITTEIEKNKTNSIFERVDRGVYKLSNQATTISTKTKSEEVIKKESEIGLIKSLGMYWKRSYVNWKNNPSIFGRQFQETASIDFKDQAGIYVLYDSQKIIYVGQAVERLGQRLYEHTTDRLNGRWDRFSWFGLLEVDENGKTLKQIDQKLNIEKLIDAFEAILIECTEPPLNRKRGNDLKEIEYLQEKDPILKAKENKFEILKSMFENDNN